MSSKHKQSASDISVNVIGHHMKQRMDVVSIDALSWAAERAGLSYGRFTLSLSPKEQKRIQAEYEEWKRKLARERAERTAERSVHPANPFSAGILLDEDL